MSKFSGLIAGVLMFFVPVALNGATLTFDFEEGSFGTYWSNLSSGDISPNLVFVDAPNSNGGEAVISGIYSLGPGPWHERDQPHDLLHAQSVPFLLDGSGDLTFALTGGSDDSSVAPNLGSDPVITGVQGVALTRVSDGERVLSQVANFESTTTTITWSQATLATYAAEVGETWTIDVYDSFSQSNEWSWYAVDDISIPGVIPEPSPYVLALVAFCLAGKRQRR